MINVNLNQNTSIAIPTGSSILDLAQNAKIKNIVAATIDDVPANLSTILENDCSVKIISTDTPDGDLVYQRTVVQILAQAVKRLYPESQFAGYSITDKGFYCDFDIECTVTAEILRTLSTEMENIVKEKTPIHYRFVSKQEALALFLSKGESYKCQKIKDYAPTSNVIIYEQGDYFGICDGPVMSNTSKVKVKSLCLLSASGAYWRGNEQNKMLQRIHGVAFMRRDLLDAYFAEMEAAKMKDHNRIGREMEYFTTIDSIGQGLPVLLPNGARVIQLLQRWVEDTEQKHGYLLTKTPLLAKKELYQISGHWNHYLDGMFIIGDPDSENQECFALRPMTCPFQYQVYLNKERSYRDLPMRLGETSTLFRNEDSGEMHGLIRVRQFTISEGHLILRPDQLESEFEGCLALAKYMLETVGLLDGCTFRFSQWDPENKNGKYEGTSEQWETAQNAMATILNNLELEYEIGIDEAAFYGPKLDIQYRNVFGKEDTLVTIQIDMLLAQKFGMTYTDKDGKKKTPYIIHRTSLGCYERTLAYMLETFSGALPLWLMPIQVRVLPITDRVKDYACETVEKLSGAGIRAEGDYRNEKLGYKIREAQQAKIPYMLVIGEHEAQTGTISVRTRSGAAIPAMSIDDFLAMCLLKIENKDKGL